MSIEDGSHDLGSVERDSLSENGLDQNHNLHLQHQRLWNPHLLPGYAVIAVDRRLPENPVNAVVERGRLRAYHQCSAILRDRHYVRYQRLHWERVFTTTPAFAQLVEILSIHDMFTYALDSARERAIALGLDPTYEESRVETLLQDYCMDQYALTHWMN